MSRLKTFMIRWNNDHPLDRGFREKYKMSFNSKEHREINQYDVLLEYVENALMKEVEESIAKDREKKSLLERGIWINDNVSEEVSDDLFDNLDVSLLNSGDSELQVEE